MSNDTNKQLRVLLESIYAQVSTGLAFSNSEYDLRRYQRILETLKSVLTLLNGGDLGSVNVGIDWETAANGTGSQEYVTPKVAVATVVFNDDGEVLLVQREQDLWTLPGGYAEVGLEPARNAEKETKEEAGVEVRVVTLLGVFDSNQYDFPVLGRQVYTLVFYAELLGGSVEADPVETLGASFFRLGSLPAVPSGTRTQIGLASRVHQGESVLPFFDREDQSTGL